MIIGEEKGKCILFLRAIGLNPAIPKVKLPVSKLLTFPPSPPASSSHSASSAAGAAIRDSKHRELGSLVFPHSEWQAFLDAVKERGF